MKNTKLTIRVSRDLLENAKRYARQHDTTLTRLVSSYLQRLSIRDDPLTDSPTVKRLSGILSRDVSEQDYNTYLEGKYGQNPESSD